MIGALLAKYGLFALFFAAGLEGEAAVIAGGVMAQQGLATLPAVMLVATCGSFTADQLWFQLGRRGRHWKLFQRLSSKRPFARAMALLDRRPIPFILGFRFVYGMRIGAPVAIGASQIRPRLFVPLNLLAAAIWAPLFSYIGFRLGAEAMPLVKRWGGVGALAIALILAAVVIVWLLMRRRARADEKPPLPEADGAA